MAVVELTRRGGGASPSDTLAGACAVPVTVAAAGAPADWPPPERPGAPPPPRAHGPRSPGPPGPPRGAKLALPWRAREGSRSPCPWSRLRSSCLPYNTESSKSAVRELAGQAQMLYRRPSTLLSFFPAENCWSTITARYILQQRSIIER